MKVVLKNSTIGVLQFQLTGWIGTVEPQQNHYGFLFWLLNQAPDTFCFAAYIPSDFDVSKSAKIRLWGYEEGASRDVVLSLGTTKGGTDLLNSIAKTPANGANTEMNWAISASTLTANSWVYLSLTLSGTPTHCVNLASLPVYVNDS
jgi:hypothetical protein